MGGGPPMHSDPLVTLLFVTPTASFPRRGRCCPQTRTHSGMDSHRSARTSINLRGVPSSTHGTHMHRRRPERLLVQRIVKGREAGTVEEWSGGLKCPVNVAACSLELNVEGVNLIAGQRNPQSKSCHLLATLVAGHPRARHLLIVGLAFICCRVC